VALANESDAVATNSRRLSVIRVISPNLWFAISYLKNTPRRLLFRLLELNSPGQKAFALCDGLARGAYRICFHKHRLVNC